MLQKLFDADDLAILVFFPSFFILTAVILYWITFSPRLTPWVDRCVGITGPFYMVVVPMFALATAFLGASVWGSFDAHLTAVKNERIAILHYFQVVKTSPTLDGEKLLGHLQKYVDSAINEEWQEFVENKSSNRTTEHFDRLLFASALGASQASTDSLTAQRLSRAAERLLEARSQRTSFRWVKVDALRWLVVMFLGILAQFALVLTGLDKRQKIPMAIGLGTLTIMVSMVVTMIGLSVNHYSGIVKVTPEPLRETLEVMKR